MAAKESSVARLVTVTAPRRLPVSGKITLTSPVAGKITKVLVEGKNDNKPIQTRNFTFLYSHQLFDKLIQST